MTFSVSCAAQAVRDTLFVCASILLFSSSFASCPSFQLGGGELLAEVKLSFLKTKKLLDDTPFVVGGSAKVVGRSPFQALEKAKEQCLSPNG